MVLGGSGGSRNLEGPSGVGVIVASGDLAPVEVAVLGTTLTDRVNVTGASLLVEASNEGKVVSGITVKRDSALHVAVTAALILAVLAGHRSSIFISDVSVSERDNGKVPVGVDKEG